MKQYPDPDQLSELSDLITRAIVSITLKEYANLPGDGTEE